MRECLCIAEQPLRRIINKSPGRTPWAMPQWRFLIASLHHVAARRQSIYFAPKRSGGSQTAAFQLFRQRFCDLTVRAGQLPVAWNRSIAIEHRKSYVSPRPVKTDSANRRGSARRSIHTLRPCGTHKHRASEKIVNRCCRRPLLAEAPLAMYGVRNRSPQFVRSIELESAERHLPYQSRRSFLRFYRILPLREKSSARGVIRFKDSCAALNATFHLC